MRLIFALTLACLAAPVFAWEFSASPVCTLTHTDSTGTITVTYDAALPQYSVTVTLPVGVWPDATGFAMAFAGDRPIGIQTDRHRISPDGRSLQVTDSGFGNMLDGLEYNQRVYAMAGDTTVGLSLSGIGPAITAFRACPAAYLA